MLFYLFFPQDHLELFFGYVRSLLGSNNNPTCRQFESISKKLLTKLELQDVRGGNCQQQDGTSLLTVSSFKHPIIHQSTEALQFESALSSDPSIISLNDHFSEEDEQVCVSLFFMK